VHLDRIFWRGDRPLLVGPTEGEQPVPPAAVYDPRIPHWRAEAWVRGSWVDVGAARFELDPADVWHQVEVTRAGARADVRIGGVLRASRPDETEGTASFAADGDVAHVTATSALDDAAVHHLPARSTYVWRWRGRGPLELELAVDGTIDLVVGGELTTYEGDRGAYRSVQLRHERGTDEIAVHAGADGALVTDLAVRARL
jgi:hypothetical protein